MPGRGTGRGGIRPSTLNRMSNEQLKKAGYIRIPGFTKSDGTKVKAHIRNLKPAKGGKETTMKMAELAVDFTPIVGDIKAGAEAIQAFSDKDYLAGAVLTGAALIALVPIVGDAARIPIKAFANTLKASAKVVKTSAKVAKASVKTSKAATAAARTLKAATKAPPTTAARALEKVGKKTLKFSDEGGDILKQAKAQRLVKAQVIAEKRLAKSNLLKANIKKEVAEAGAVKASKTIAKVKVGGKEYAVKKVRKDWLRIEAHGMHFEGNTVAAVKESLAFHVKYIL